MYEGKYLGSRVAIKKLELRGDKAIEAAEAEFAIMHELRHTHLVLSYGACIDVRLPHSLAHCHDASDPLSPGAQK